MEKTGFEPNPKHAVGYRPVAYHGPGWSRHACPAPASAMLVQYPG